jgi:hypothetical protein
MRKPQQRSRMLSFVFDSISLDRDRFVMPAQPAQERCAQQWCGPAAGGWSSPVELYQGVLELPLVSKQPGQFDTRFGVLRLSGKTLTQHNFGAQDVSCQKRATDTSNKGFSHPSALAASIIDAKSRTKPARSSQQIGRLPDECCINTTGAFVSTNDKRICFRIAVALP